MKVAIVCFSPTGGTERCAREVGAQMGEVVQRIDLTEGGKPAALSDEAEAVVIAVPSYGGRVPGLAAERLAGIAGNGKRAVLMAVYGNRAFEDTLVELHDVALAQGFVPVAAVSAIAQHCMDGRIATGRPDEADLAKLREFGAALAGRVSTGSGLQLPGNRPYKKAGAGMTPVTGDGCTACGECADRCPAQAISPDEPGRIDAGRCIGCMRCVAICPSRAKRLPAAKRLLVHTFLSATASKRKEPEIFICHEH